MSYSQKLRVLRVTQDNKAGRTSCLSINVRCVKSCVHLFSMSLHVSFIECPYFTWAIAQLTHLKTFFASVQGADTEKR